MQNQNANTNTNGHRRQTPGRRRQSRNATQSPAFASQQRNYASENDVADLLLGDATFRREASDSPQTPRKTSPSNPRPNSQQAKPRTNNKQRSKNAAASPIPVKSGRKTPPQPVTQSAKAPASAAAFAGATFHASPAPSSLPIPSFMSKAMPDSPGAAGSRRPINQEPSPPPTDSERPTPTHNRSSAALPSREESPLDIFFRADRAEKEKARRASSANVGVAGVFGPFSPPSQPRSPLRAGPSAVNEGPFQVVRPQLQRNSTAGSPVTEMIDTPAKGMGPAFSTPYTERIKAARSTDKQARDFPEMAPHHQQSVVDRSEALKNFLFAGQKQPVPSTPVATAQYMGSSPPYGSARPPRSHARHVYGTPDSADRRSANLLAFEDDLRRILKLDSPLSLGAKPPALANAHTH